MLKIQTRKAGSAIAIRDPGRMTHRMRQAYNRAAKAAWRDVAEHFHLHLRDKRFTPEHAREAGYTRRKGELQPPGSKAFARSYYGRKYYSRERGGGYMRANPLESSGDTRRALQAMPNITSTSKGGRASYRGASVFNYRHPKSQVRMSEEFRRITQSESVELARVFDAQLDKYLAHIRGS